MWQVFKKSKLALFWLFVCTPQIVKISLLLSELELLDGKCRFLFLFGYDVFISSATALYTFSSQSAL